MEYLAIAGSIISVVGAVGGLWWFYPTVVIQPAGLASNAPTTAQFTFANSGNVTVYDLVLACRIDTPKVSFDKIEGNMGKSPLGKPRGQRLAKLSPGETATRDCGAEAGDERLIGGVPYPAEADVAVTFGWPRARWRRWSVSRHFSSTRDAAGRTFMVPDAD